MATLEKIRSKSALLLIVIGVALLAFIIGDFFKLSSIFGQDTTAVQVKGADVKIDVRDWQNALNEASQQVTNLTDNQRSALDQEVLRNMVFDQLRKAEYDRLGLTVTNDELNDAVNGSAATFADYLVASQSRGQIQSVAQYYDMTNNATKYGADPQTAQQYQTAWLQFEDMLKQQLLEHKFASMLQGTMVANKLDGEQFYNAYNTAYQVAVARVPYASLSNADYQVDDAEIEAAWNTDKQMYALAEPTRRVSVINVPIVASEEDRQAAAKLMGETAAELSSCENLDALKGKKGFNSQRTTLTVELIDQMVKNGANPRLKTFVDSAAIGSAEVIAAGDAFGYQVAKLFATGVAPDSIELTIVAIDPATAKSDDILSKLNAGLSLDSIRSVEGVVAALDSIPTSILNPNVPIQDIGQLISGDITAYKDMFETVEVGRYFLPDTLNFNNANGVSTIYAVTKRNAPVRNVEFALVNYTLEPSDATVNNLRDNLQKFITENNTAEKFVENAVAANYNAMPSYITPSTPYIYMTDAFGNLIPDQQTRDYVQVTNSKPLVAWALEAEKGEVSTIFGSESQGNLAVIAVDDIYADYTPATDPQVKRQLTEKVRNQKKGDALVAKYKGAAKDMAGYAAAMKVGVDSVAVNFVRDNYGADVMAGIATAAVGKVSEPTKGSQSMYVYQVNTIDAPQRPFDLSKDGMIFQQLSGVASLGTTNGLFRLLLGKNKVVNNLYKVTSEGRMRQQQPVENNN